MVGSVENHRRPIVCSCILLPDFLCVRIPLYQKQYTYCTYSIAGYCTVPGTVRRVHNAVYAGLTQEKKKEVPATRTSTSLHFCPFLHRPKGRGMGNDVSTNKSRKGGSSQKGT